MKKLMMIALMMCFIGRMSYGQDTIITKNNEIIIATKIVEKNVPIETSEEFDNVWVKGVYYTDINGERKTIEKSKIKSISGYSHATKKEAPPTNKLNLGGYYIEEGSKLKNTSIIVSLLGAGLSVIGATKEGGNPLLIFGGVAIIASIPINIIGNNKITKGGRLIKKFMK